MLNDPQKILSLFASIAAFGLVLSLWLMGVVIWSSKRQKKAKLVQERLKFARAMPAVGDNRVLRLWHDGKESTTVVPGAREKGGILDKLEKIRTDAGWETPLGTALLGVLSMALFVAAASYLLTSNLVVALMSPFGALVIMWIFIAQRISKRRATFERQLIDALSLAGRSLRIGHPLVGSFRLISEEVPAPVGILFAEICQQQALGVPMDRALRAAAEVHYSEDLKLFATSVVIQLNSGGNLADMMERLANVIRERQRLARRVKVLTAQTEFSKRILLAMPFLVFVILNLINPDYMRPLYTTASGEIIMVVSSIGLFLGWVTMNRLSKLTY